MSFKIPRIISENLSETNLRMILSIGVIVVLIVLFMIMVEKNMQIPNTGSKLRKPGNIGIKYENVTKPVVCQYVLLRNINKTNIPVDKIVVMSDDTQLHALYANDGNVCIIDQHSPYGSMMLFYLPKEMMVTKIIIDSNPFGTYHNNLQTTQVETLDSNFNSTWTYTQTIRTDTRYAELPIVEPRIIYDTPSQSLPVERGNQCDGGTQELILNKHLASNIWRDTND